MPKVEYGVYLPGHGRLATAEGVSTIALRAEELGFSSVWAADHVALPLSSSSQYPNIPDGIGGVRPGSIPWDPHDAWLDPLIALTWAAAVTKTVRLGTSVLVLPMRPVLLVAKTVSTLDHLAGGRVILGVGTGWWEEEFQLLDQSFADRGPRTTEAIQVLKACWAQEDIVFQGEYHRYAAFAMAPKPAQGGRLPVLCGGGGELVLARAAQVADGWMPSHLLPEQVKHGMLRLHYLAESVGRPVDQLMVVAFPGKENPLDLELASAYTAVGLDAVVGDIPRQGSLKDAVRALESLALTLRL